MDFDDRPDFAKRLEKARIARGFKTAKDATKFFGWTYETYIQHEQGIRGIGRQSKKYADAFRVSEGWLLTGEGDGPDRSADAILDFRPRVVDPEIEREAARYKLYLYRQKEESEGTPTEE